MPDPEETSTVATETVTTPPTPPAVEPADDFDKDRAMATIRTLRAFEKDAKAKIARLAELEQAEADRQSADLSEADKLRKKLEAAEQREAAANARLNAELIKNAAASAATALSLPFAGQAALDDAVALGAFQSLEMSDDGKVTGINDAIKALHKARPYLFGQAPNGAPDINAGARGSNPRTPQDVITAEAERLRRSGKYGGF